MGLQSHWYPLQGGYSILILMGDNMTIIIALIFTACLGFMAQWIGLCMLRGVKELLQGKPAFLAAILCCGFWGWLAQLTVITLPTLNTGKTIAPEVTTLPWMYYQANGWFFLGGIIFGLGSAFNQGCGISTLSRLARGELAMFATISGWLIGWCLLVTWPIHLAKLQPLPLPEHSLWILLAGSVASLLWALASEHTAQKNWLSILAIGVVAGFIFLVEPAWSPSSLLQDLSRGLLHDSDPHWPDPSRFIWLAALLTGMAMAAWRTKSVSFKRPGIAMASRHLAAGVLMGLGGAMAMGGNDAQLLLALPLLSGAGLLSIAGMVSGMYIGLGLLRRVKATTN